MSTFATTARRRRPWLACLTLLWLNNPIAPAYELPYWYPPDHLQQTAAGLQRAAPQHNCPADYRRLLQDGRLDIEVFFGYMKLSLSGIVLDPYNKQDLRRQLLQDCPAKGLQACGFQPERGRPDVLSKPLTPWPGEPVQVMLRLHDSALAQDRQAIAEDPIGAQTSKTKAVTKAFLQALQRADVVLYVGHSRYGTGPGFGPLPFASRAWFDAWLLHPLTPRMHQTLQASRRRPALIGLLACSTGQAYQQRLRDSAPQTTWISTRGDTYSDMDNASLLAALNALLGLYCRDDFARAIQTGNAEATHYELTHWFTRPALPAGPSLPWGMRPP